MSLSSTQTVKHNTIVRKKQVAQIHVGHVTSTRVAPHYFPILFIFADKRLCVFNINTCLDDATCVLFLPTLRATELVSFLSEPFSSERKGAKNKKRKGVTQKEKRSAKRNEARKISLTLMLPSSLSYVSLGILFSFSFLFLSLISFSAIPCLGYIHKSIKSRMSVVGVCLLQAGSFIIP